jgi:hypothetical protein
MDGCRGRGPRRGPRSTGPWCTGHLKRRGTRSAPSGSDPTMHVARTRWSGGGDAEGAVCGGGPPEHRRRRRPGATGHHLRRGLNKEKEEDGAKLTSGSLTAVGRCRRRAAMRGGRDHGCPPGRGLRPRLRAFEGGDGVLGVLRVQRRGRRVRSGPMALEKRRRRSASPRRRRRLHRGEEVRARRKEWKGMREGLKHRSYRL